MTEFEAQLAARVQAMDFLLQAVLRGQFANMTPAEARQNIELLEKQFSTISVPPDADIEHTDSVMAMHSDAQHFLSRTLANANPHQKN